MGLYAVQFEWPGGVEDEVNFDLDAETWELAKLQAARLFAGAQFKRIPPTGYRIIQNGGTEVWRFPEPSLH